MSPFFKINASYIWKTLNGTICENPFWCAMTFVVEEIWVLHKGHPQSIFAKHFDVFISNFMLALYMTLPQSPSAYMYWYRISQFNSDFSFASSIFDTIRCWHFCIISWWTVRKKNCRRWRSLLSLTHIKTKSRLLVACSLAFLHRFGFHSVCVCVCVSMIICYIYVYTEFVIV